MPDIQFDVNYEHLSFLLNHGVAAWNYWREQNPIAILVLSGANLSRPVLATTPIGDQIGNPEVNSANFRDIDLDHVLLEKANLEQADFCGAHFQSADMQQANLSGGNFYKANFARADLAGAKLRGGNFQNADFQNANLRGADLRDANFT